jgi:hypothetical protein
MDIAYIRLVVQGSVVNLEMFFFLVDHLVSMPRDLLSSDSSRNISLLEYCVVSFSLTHRKVNEYEKCGKH